MASEERKKADDAIKQQNLHNALGAEEQEAETSAFQCSKCKQWKTRYRQAQTRSADEPMTVCPFPPSFPFPCLPFPSFLPRRY
jgi:transcription elongation factor S-II